MHIFEIFNNKSKKKIRPLGFVLSNWVKVAPFVEMGKSCFGLGFFGGWGVGGGN